MIRREEGDKGDTDFHGFDGWVRIGRDESEADEGAFFNTRHFDYS